MWTAYSNRTLVNSKLVKVAKIIITLYKSTFRTLFYSRSIVEMSKFFKKIKFQKWNRDWKTYTIHQGHFDYEKVPKQDEQVNSLCIWN